MRRSQASTKVPLRTCCGGAGTAHRRSWQAACRKRLLTARCLRCRLLRGCPARAHTCPARVHWVTSVRAVCCHGAHITSTAYSRPRCRNTATPSSRTLDSPSASSSAPHSGTQSVACSSEDISTAALCRVFPLAVHLATFDLYASGAPCPAVPRKWSSCPGAHHGGFHLFWKGRRS